MKFDPLSVFSALLFIVSLLRTELKRTSDSIQIKSGKKTLMHLNVRTALPDKVRIKSKPNLQTSRLSIAPSNSLFFGTTWLFNAPRSSFLLSRIGKLLSSYVIPFSAFPRPFRPLWLRWLHLLRPTVYPSASFIAKFLSEYEHRPISGFSRGSIAIPLTNVAVIDQHLN